MQTEKFTHADAIDAARIIHRRRPQWDPPGIVAALGRVAYELDIAQALSAGLSAASDPEAKSPAAIAWDRHRTKAAPPRTDAETTSEPRCRDHAWHIARNCPACWSEVKAPPHRPERMVGLHWEPAAAPTEAVSPEAASSLPGTEEEPW